MKKSFDDIFKITPKQQKCIESITYFTNKEFTGSTKEDAREFINKYLELSKEIHRDRMKKHWDYYNHCKKAWYRRSPTYVEGIVEDWFDFSMFT